MKWTLGFLVGVTLLVAMGYGAAHLRAADPAPAAGNPACLVQGHHLIVVSNHLVSVYRLDALPRLALVNALPVPASLQAARRLADGSDMMGMMAPGMMRPGMAGPGPGYPGRTPASQAAVTGTPGQQGRQVFQSQNCSSCHQINGRGGTVGPDLTHVGSRRTPAWIKTQITDPRAHDPNTIMPSYSIPAQRLDALVAYLSSLK